MLRIDPREPQQIEVQIVGVWNLGDTIFMRVEKGEMLIVGVIFGWFLDGFWMFVVGFCAFFGRCFSK